MTTRRHYLVSYDIACDEQGDKRRNKVFEALLARGDHIQFSVFFCQLNARELAELKQQLIPLIHHTEDQVLIVDLGPARSSVEESTLSLGRPFVMPSRARIV